ncbi:MAG: hypothetical protein ABJC39_04020, partial [Chloroflexota bacterium]
MAEPCGGIVIVARDPDVPAEERVEHSTGGRIDVAAHWIDGGKQGWRELASVKDRVKRYE